MTAISASKHHWLARRGPGRFRRSDRGAAAAEFALVLAVLVPALANAVDVGLYGFRRVQVELAAEAGVQAIRVACTPAQTPVTRNCATGLMAKITTAVQSTSLGTSATVAGGSPVEGYYCVSSSTGLVLLGSTGTLSAPPPAAPGSDCSSVVSGNNASPGDYVQVTVNYTYTPLFPAASIVSLLPSPIARTAWYRVR
jgi:Flp pilus assembly protein TadG